MSWAEAKWVVDSILQKTGQAPNNMRAFTAYSLNKSSIGLKFLEPADSYDSNGNLLCSVGGVMIRMSETGYPANASDGTLVVDNAELGKYAETPFAVENLTMGKTYYFSAFPYSAQGVYNLSSNTANRAQAAPADGEVAKVTISIDDASAFNSVVVTCVDETDSNSTQNATLTSTQNTASFTVPIGHVYHIEYGAEDGYSKPENTVSKTSVAGATTEYTATYYYFTATINVTYPAGAICTCECGNTKYTAPSDSGSYTFKVHSVGTWIITATSGTDTDSKTVSITSTGQTANAELSFVKIYGISRDITNSSPAWARTDSAIGKTATATIGTAAGASDFDDCYPWSGIVRETLSTGDVMVKIPKFWYRRYLSGDVEHIQIADKATTGFTLHPAFNHAGAEKDCVYIGAYKTSSSDKSVSGASPQLSQTRAAFRTNAKNKGAGWGLIDIAAVSAVQMLILVEFANNNVQSVIGRGYCDENSSRRNTGSCDSVTNLTGIPAGTNGAVDVVWRGIEGFWGNAWEFVDGVNYKDGTYFVSNDPSEYADDTSFDKSLSYQIKTTLSSAYIKTVGLDTNGNPHIMLPCDASGGTETTYMCDATWTTTGWRVVTRSGRWDSGSKCGLFMTSYGTGSASAVSDVSARLLYIPS